MFATVSKFKTIARFVFAIAAFLSKSIPERTNYSKRKMSPPNLQALILTSGSDEQNEDQRNHGCCVFLSMIGVHLHPWFISTMRKAAPFPG